MSRQIDFACEPMADDQVLVRWTDLDGVSGVEVCEATVPLDELAAIERGEAMLNPMCIERRNLATEIAALEARQEGIRTRRRQMLDRWPELQEGGGN